MNKKKLMTFGLSLVVCLVLVSAAVYMYVGSVGVDVTVGEPLLVDSDEVSFNGYPGYVTANILIDNLANVPLGVELSFDEISNDVSFSLETSEGICMDYYPEEGWRDKCEERIVLDGMPLVDFDTMSWDASSIVGYVSHIDLILDNGESLTFEYATFTETCNTPSTYPEGEYTFNVDDDSYAWESLPGACGVQAFDDQHLTLAEWKTTYPGATITKIELEVDNWIEESSSDVSNIVINGEEIKVDYELETTTTTVLADTLGQEVSVTFRVADDSPVGEFAGVINVARV